jgi:hypothetical protein
MNPTRLIHRLLLVWLIPGVIIYGGLVYDLLKFPTAPGIWDGTPLFRWLGIMVYAPFTIVVGILLMRRVPGNIVGIAVVLWGITNAAWQIRSDISSEGVFLPFLTGIFVYAVGLNTFIIINLYFPDGNPFPRRLENLFAVFFAGSLILRPLWIFSIANFSVIAPDYDLSNPFYIPALASVEPVLNLVASASTLLVVIIPVVLYLRFRAATYEVRQQIKWLAFGGIISVPFQVMLTVRINDSLLFYGILRSLTFSYLNVLPAFTIIFAILRHRLYDIDIIIRRTLIYSMLTGVLGVIYFGGVIVTQQLFQAVTGDTPDIAIVLSTLLIAALFSPLRSRIQDVIDRRLYRRKYDVEQTLAQFNQSLRDEVDVKTLQANLIGVVSDTMQPDKIALWVKE